ncbi:MAG TPA: AbrB/MazE/SpoVT family DNA-binding domain-containing protein [Alphaproteobacteria bacterium]|jgi:putative addiction module antidote
MSEKIKLRKIGNSQGVVLPKEILERHGLAEGDTLYIVDTAEGIKLTPYDPVLAKGMEAFARTRRKYRNALRQLAK